MDLNLQDQLAKLMDAVNILSTKLCEMGSTIALMDGKLNELKNDMNIDRKEIAKELEVMKSSIDKNLTQNTKEIG